MAPTTVKDGLVISLEYVLKLDDGQIVDESPADEPLLYLHGAENIIPGLEKELTGMAINDTKQVVVTPEDGYGDYEDEAIEVIDRGLFPPDVELEEGLMLTMRDEEGNMMDATVVELDENEVTLDFNHPLAGETLVFDVKIVGIREATDEERDHGHPHVPGMHHH
jgi:FKBP-type peptidyl-prolyl cis-trans isomerase SlyD